MRTVRCYLVAAILPLILIACGDDGPMVVPDEGIRSGHVPVGEGQSIDLSWAHLAQEEIPGFAGMYLKSDGTPVVMSADTASRTAAVSYANSIRSTIGGGGQAVEFRKVQYDFSQLKEWSDELTRILFRNDYVLTSDIDEVHNKILIEVESEAFTSSVYATVEDSSVPVEAVRVQQGTRPTALQSLTQKVRPVDGGYEIGNADFPAGTCTFGFNTPWDGDPAFVTAGHCTEDTVGVDGNRITQPAFADQIGVEVAAADVDTGFYNFNGSSGLCSGCFFADVSVIAIDDTVQSRVGYIAETDDWGYLQSGSKQVVDSWKIFNKLGNNYMIVGSWLSKVGASSGWTRGKVTQTCVNVNWYPGTVMCQWKTNIYTLGGDSGSPVVLDSNSHPPTDVDYVHLAGIMWGAITSTETFFSPIDNIEYELGASLSACEASNSC